MRRVAPVLLTVAWLAVLGGCSVEETLPPPECEEGGSVLIVAQSVRTASQIPCLDPLPTGWTVDRVRVNEEHTVVTLDSDRAGDDAAVLRVESACRVDHAVSAPSDQPNANRFDFVEQVEPSFRAERYYVFPGGCVSWTFDFDRDVSATQSVAIGDSLTLVPRDALNADIRESFIDEEI
jgi:hypothetical protein